MEGNYHPGMFPLHMTILCVLFGSSSGFLSKEVCYGNHLRFPYAYTPPLYRGQVFFTPSNGGPRRLMMENGKSKDPRMKVSVGSSLFTDLKESDEGTFSILLDGNIPVNIIKLRILDCTTQVLRNYGETFFVDVPRQTEFLEFTPSDSVDQTMVLWNRTNPQSNKGGRGRVRSNTWEIKHVTQKDNGHYNFRKKDNTLLSRLLFRVQENERMYNKKAKERLIIHNPFDDASWTVTYIPDEHDRGGEMVIREGKDPEYDSITMRFSGRLRVVRSGIEIDPVESRDSGTFKFRDEQGNLAQTVRVTVQPEVASVLGYIGIIVGVIFVMIICCCCVRKCCCKKSSSKVNEPAPAPAVYHHDRNQPAGRSSSAAPATNYSYQPMIPSVSREPATTPSRPSVYNPVNVHVNPPEPEVHFSVQVAAPGGPVAAPSLNPDCLSSDPEPQFELKGLLFSSAPPLSSDSNYCDVYTSDKLNFL